MVNVVVATPRTIQVSANVSGTTLTTSRPVTLKNDTTLSSVITKLDSLNDVNADNESNNATLVYDSTTDTYVVKQLDLDGGTF
jgi:hypothetical protein